MIRASWGSIAGTLLGLGTLVALAACTLPGGARIEPPSPIPAPPTPLGGAPPTELDEPQGPAVEASVTPAPPTVPPPELGAPAELRRLSAGSELVLTEIKMFGPQSGWGVGGSAPGDGRILRTEDGGGTWVEVTPPIFFAEGGAELATRAYFLDLQHAWVLRYAAVEVALPSATGLPLVVWSTVDGGTSWSHSAPRFAPFIGTASAPPYLQFSDPGRGWLLARAGGAGMHQYPVALLSTEDGGGSWQLLQEPFSGQGLDSCSKSGMAFAAGGGGILTIESCPVTGAEARLTVDAGRTWQAITLPEPQAPAGLYDRGVCESYSPQWDGDALLLAVRCRTFDGETGTYDFLFRSEDGGNTFFSRTYPGGSLALVDDETLYALGRELHRSLDGGASWELRKQLAWDGQFSFATADLGWAVARSEGEVALVVTTDGGDHWQILEPTIAGQ